MSGTPAADKKQIPIVCPGHTRPLAELQFCRADNRIFLVSACHDRLPMMRDGVSGDWIGTWKGHKGAVWSCRLDPTASLAATASGDFSVQIWDAINGALIWTYPHNHIVKTCDFSSDSRQLATGGHEGILRIYNLEQQQKQKKPVKPLEIPPVMADENNSKVVMIGKLNWMTDTVLLTGSSDGRIRFWNISGVTPQTAPSLKPFFTLETDGNEIRDMELTTVTDTSQQILTVAAGDKVYFFDVSNASASTAAQPKLLHSYKMPIHFRAEGGASLHPSGLKFIAGGSDLWVRVFDFATGSELECLKGHHGPIRCLRYSPDGKLYASGSEDGTIRLWQDFVAE